MTINLTRLIKPLRFDYVWFVIHASGSMQFFCNEEQARHCAYLLDRGYSLLNEKAIAKHGERLSTAKAEWEAEQQSNHTARVLAAIDTALIEELVEAATKMRNRFDTIMRGRTWSLADLVATKHFDHALAKMNGDK
jgi:hypothetical protein